jgi:putative ABC transport system substrate-binding protein
MLHMSNRREFILLLGGAAAAWPLAARAQQPAKVPTIGFLGAATQLSWTQWTAAFVQRLRELGWVEGSTVRIEYRWAEGSGVRAAETVAEFVRMKVDVIVTTGAVILSSKAMRAFSAIPTVFATASDPVGNGLVASLTRPGGNITGLSNQQSEIATKRLELLHEVVPGLRRLGVIVNADNPAAMLDSSEVASAAGTLGLTAVTAEIRGSGDISPAFDVFKNDIQSLYVCSDFLTYTLRIGINTFAYVARLPTIYGEREQPEAGGLMSYGPNFPNLFRRAADFVDKILRGTKPADLPVEQPTKFDLVINLTTAKALGLKIPEAFLLRADELIE